MREAVAGVKNLEKRRRVMDRSIRLGHCICDPKLQCPCDTLREHDVCPCAGERLTPPPGPVRLTRLVEKAGCASKIDQASLKAVLGKLPVIDDPRVLLGVPAGDDAGVFKMNGGPALVQTVDVFSPSVDDPYRFGQVAAANSVSDVYAMGGRPICALSVLGFPVGEVPDQAMVDILRGGIDKMTEAGVAIIGGHSINDREIKAGFAVTGLIDPAAVVTKGKAQPGDVFILTKPIGTGILAFAAQIDRAPALGLEAATSAMTTLNKAASEAMVDSGAHACTDVTGFGLIGHLAEIALGSGVDVELRWEDIPLFPGVIDCAADGIIPGAVERNKESSGDRVVLGNDAQPVVLDVCCDAQTSGGLLIALPEPDGRKLLARLHDEGVSDAAIIGSVTGNGSGRLTLRSDGTRPIPERGNERVDDAPEPSAAYCAEQESSEKSCCADGHEAGGAAASTADGVTDIQQKFQEFLKRAGAPGALDVATKQAISIALSVLAKCEPCVEIHIKKARQMGFSQAEIDEAAWMAIAFGGSPTMMFYNRLRTR